MKNLDRISLLVSGLVAAGAALRLWGIGFGLPMTLCRPDEAFWVVRVAWGFGRGDLNPHVFHYPTLYPYALFLLYCLYYAGGRAAGLFTRPEFIAGYTLDPSAFYLLGRLLTAATGVLTIFLIYRLGRRAYGRGVGVLSAAFLAFACGHVRDAHFAKTDVVLVLWIVLAFVFILRLAEGGGRSDAILAGLCVGLGASTKYNGLMMGLPMALAFVVRHLGRRASPEGSRDRLPGLLRDPDLYLSGAAALVGLFATSPYILLDFKTFLRDIHGPTVYIREIQRKYADMGSGWVYHARFSLPHSLGWALSVLGAAGVLHALWRRRTPDLLLLGFALAYYATVGSGWLVFVRYVLPILPILCLFAARLLWDLAGRISPRRQPLIAAGAAVLCLVEPACLSVLYDRVLSRKDTRLLAAEWIAARVPSGARVALGGNVWGRPDLLESPEILNDRLRAIRREGGEGGAIRALLDSPRYRARPSYFVVSIGDSISPLRGGGPAIPDRHIDRLLAEGIDYLVVNTHPHLKNYGGLEPGLAGFLNRRSMSPVATFTPTDGAEYPPPVFDPIDAFYVPLARYGNTVRPGPYIHIYRLSP